MFVLLRKYQMSTKEEKIIWKLLNAKKPNNWKYKEWKKYLNISSILIEENPGFVWGLDYDHPLNMNPAAEIVLGFLLKQYKVNVFVSCIISDSASLNTVPLGPPPAQAIEINNNNSASYFPCYEASVTNKIICNNIINTLLLFGPQKTFLLLSSP